MNKKKVVILVLVIVLAAGAVGGGIFAFKKQKDKGGRLSGIFNGYGWRRW